MLALWAPVNPREFYLAMKMLGVSLRITRRMRVGAAASAVTPARLGGGGPSPPLALDHANVMLPAQTLAGRLLSPPLVFRGPGSPTVTASP